MLEHPLRIIRRNLDCIHQRGAGFRGQDRLGGKFGGIADPDDFSVDRFIQAVDADAYLLAMFDLRQMRGGEVDLHLHPRQVGDLQQRAHRRDRFSRLIIFFRDHPAHRGQYRGVVNFFGHQGQLGLHLFFPGSDGSQLLPGGRYRRLRTAELVGQVVQTLPGGGILFVKGGDALLLFRQVASVGLSLG